MSAALAEPKPLLVDGRFEQLPIAQISANPHNYRKTRDAEEDKRLEESVRTKGVLQPLLVRPVAGKDDRYEVVFGNRRLLAARSAKLSFVPCQIRAMADAEALEVALVENVQRKDVHPIEEAEGFAELVRAYKYSVADIATKTGRTENWVRSRLRLAEVDKAGRKACLDGKLSAAIVMMVARLAPAELQPEAFAELVRESQFRPMHEAYARRTVLMRYVRRMENAEWRLDDAKLEPQAGPCSSCPKRSANDRGLFAEVDKEDICLDGACWQNKLGIHRTAMLARAEKEGITVLEGAAAKKAIRGEGYLHADDTEWNGKKHVQIRTIAEKAKVQPVLAIDDDRGLVTLYPEAKVLKSLPKGAHAGASEPRNSDADAYRAKAAKAAKAARLLNRATAIALGTAVDAMAKHGFATFDEATRKLIFVALLREFWSDLFRLAAQRRGLSGKGSGKHSFLGLEELERWCKGATGGEVEALIFELIVWRARSHNEGSAFNPNVPLKALGADLAKAKKQAEAELAPKKKSKSKEKK